MAIKSDRRLYLTADRSRIVEHGDPASAWLLVPEGGNVYPGDVERYGVTVEDGRVSYDGEGAAGPLDVDQPPHLAAQETASEPAPEPEPEPEPDENQAEIEVKQSGSWYTIYRDGEEAAKVQGEDAMKAAVADLEG